MTVLSVRTFGFPVSRDFVFFGCATQLFQRVAMQQCGNQGVGTLNLLDDGLMHAADPLHSIHRSRSHLSIKFS